MNQSSGVSDFDLAVMKIVIYLALLATVVASKQHLQKDQHNVKGDTRPNIVLFFVDDVSNVQYLHKIYSHHN